MKNIIHNFFLKNVKYIGKEEKAIIYITDDLEIFSDYSDGE